MFYVSKKRSFVMVNYEEIYNTAKKNFSAAVEDRNVIRKEIAGLEEGNIQLKKMITELQESLENVTKREALLNDAKLTCEKILNPTGELEITKHWIKETDLEYKSMLESDLGVADIQTIYNYNSAGYETKIDLEKSLEIIRKFCEECSTEKKDFNTSLQKVNSAYYENNKKISVLTVKETDIQRKINYFYGEMTVAQRKLAQQC